MNIDDILAKASAEFLKQGYICSNEIVSPQRSDGTKGVHALWRLSKNPAEALYIYASPIKDHLLVTARVRNYHRMREEIREGLHGEEAIRPDEFLKQARVGYDPKQIIDEILPAFTAHYVLH
jgi:hypothetical protein